MKAVAGILINYCQISVFVQADVKGNDIAFLKGLRVSQMSGDGEVKRAVFAGGGRISGGKQKNRDYKDHGYCEYARTLNRGA